jgi:xylitol oxidase
MTSAQRNWAGNVTYTARAVHHPSSVEELQELVAAARRIRPLGSRHSFTAIADGEELVELGGLPAEVTVDPSAGTAMVAGGMTYADVAAALAPEGVALANLASLPHISVAGAIATATHGSGDTGGNLATAVRALELVGPDGERRRIGRGDPGFAGTVVGLGALGIVVRVTLDVEPAYEVRQRVFEGLSWDALGANLDAITGAGDSVSVFTRWGKAVDQVWVKSRVGDAVEAERDELLGARPATVERHPILGIDPAGSTPQLGAPGPWHERLPHFRAGLVPASGDELHSEYFVPREHGPAAIEAVRPLGDGLRPHLHVTEIRSVAADELWLSPQYGQDTLAIHFSWRNRPAAVAPLLAPLEAALAPFAPRPHWGKLFALGPEVLRERVPRLGDYAALAARTDPEGTFANAWLATRVVGAA